MLKLINTLMGLPTCVQGVRNVAIHMKVTPTPNTSHWNKIGKHSRTKWLIYFQQKMSKACLVLLCSRDKDMVPFLSNCLSQLISVARRWSRSKSSWHGVGKIPKMTSSSQNERSWERSNANQTQVFAFLVLIPLAACSFKKSKIDIVGLSVGLTQQKS